MVHDEIYERQREFIARCQANARKRARTTLRVLGVNPYTGKVERRRALSGAYHEGKAKRPPKRRVQNKFSKEEAGTIGNYVGVCRWDNSYITKACYRKKMW